MLQGPGAYNIFTEIIIEGPDQGLFVYSSSPPALGNLVETVGQTVAGTDDAGNAYLPGDTTYFEITPTDWQAAQNFEGAFSIWTATGPGGPWTQQGSMSLGSTLSSATWLAFQSGGSTATGVAFITPAGQIVGQNGNAALGTPEVWHAVTIPPGWTGSARVKIMAESNFAVFDANVTPNAASGTFGSFPSSNYYPLAAREYPVGYAGGTSSTANPRVVIPTSGAITAAGLIATFATCITQIYPLD